MQGKNHMVQKYTAMVIALFITCSLPLHASTKSSQENEKQDKGKSKEIITFESCDKDGAEKCEKETKIPVPDYSKSLK